MVPKFRIYDIIDNELYTVSGIMWHEDGIGIKFVIADNRKYVFEDGEDTWPLMRSTGVRDRNGTEIFVGDLMEWDEKEWPGPHRELVYEDHEMWRGHGWTDFCTVVDNIHQSTRRLLERRG